MVYMIMRFSAPSGSAAETGTSGTSTHFVSVGGCILVIMFLVHAGHTVVAKIGGGSVGPAVSNRDTFVIKALCRKFLISRLVLIATVASTVASTLVVIAIASIVVVLVLVHVGLTGECIGEILKFRKDFIRIC